MNLLFVFRVLAAMLLLAVPQGAWADNSSNGNAAENSATNTGEDGEDEEELRFFATTTVTATGTETDSFRLPTPVTVIDEEEIAERAPNSASDLLRLEPGVDVSGVGPNQSRPVIRGQRGLRILFLDNGLRMNNARRQTDFGEIPGLVDVSDLERVEVVRGPASVLYGSDAIGGVLNLITKTPTANSGLRGGLGLRYSSVDSQEKAHANISQGNDRWSFALGYTWRDAEDYEAASGSYGDITLADDTQVVDTGLEDTSLAGYAGFRLSDRHELFLRLNRYRADETGFGFVEPKLFGEVEDFRIRILYPFQDFDKYTLGYVGSGLDSVAADTVDVQLYYQVNERQLANDIGINIGPLFPGAPNSSVDSDTLNFTKLETFGGRGEFTKILSQSHVLTYGAEYFRDDSFNTDSSVTTTTLRFPFPPFELPQVQRDNVANAPNASNTSYGVFVQDEMLLTDKFKAIVGARYQDIETRAEATPGWDIEGLDFDDDSFVGAVNLLYQVHQRVHLVASWGRAFRAPNIIERLFNGLTPEGAGFQILNSDLESEESENFDLGIKFQSRRALFEFFYFENDIDKGIIQYFFSPQEVAALPDSVQQEIAISGVQFVVQQRNLDQLKYEGVEVNGAYRFDSGLSIGGNYSYLEGERNDAANPPNGDSYATKLNAWLRWQPTTAPYWLEYRLRHNGDENLVLQPGEPVPLVGAELPAFTVHSLAAGYSFDVGAQRHTLGLLVQNVSDELYAEFSNISFFRPQPKRNAVLTYSLGF